MTTCCFDDQAKTVTAWLGSSDSSTTFTRHCIFRFPLNSLNGKKIKFPGRLQKAPGTVLSQNDKKFWEDGIMKLLERWQKIVEQNGEYVVQ